MFWLGMASQPEQKQDAEEMSSSRRAPPQERTREAAGTEQKQAGTQNECKDLTRGRWQKEGKKNPIRPIGNEEGTSRSAGASNQKQGRSSKEHIGSIHEHMRSSQ